MALILHGEGLCCLKNVQHRHNCHSHTPKHDQTYHNNNKTKFEYRPLLNEPMEKHGAKKIWNSIASPIGRNHKTSSKRSCTNEMRRDSVCSTRSPNRSRSNSISRSFGFSNGSVSNGSDMIRRTSHTSITPTATNTTLFINATTSTVNINDSMGLQSTDCVDIELNNCDEKSPMNCVNEAICVRDNGGGGDNDLPNGSSLEICPIHMYVHRDSSEHTPITSSDSEDLHEHHHHHHHRNGLVNGLHHLHGQQSRHSHDFSSKNINIQAAVIHVIGDFIQSIGVFISAIIIKNYVS